MMNSVITGLRGTMPMQATLSLELGCVTGAQRDAAVPIVGKHVAPIQRTP